MTKETGHNNHAKIGIFSIKNTSHLSSSLITLRPSKLVITIVKLPHRTDNEWKPTKAKRIAQVSFQAKIDLSYRSTMAENETREIQNTTIDASLSQWVMTGVNAPLQISQEQ